MRILLVEDDPSIAASLSEAFSRRGDSLDMLDRATPAVATLEGTIYDLAIVDVGLPDMDGIELVRRLRRGGLRLPVLILTARDAIEDRVRGLNAGADDYVVKPFSIEELVARCVAIVRRSRSASSSVLTCGSLEIDLGTREAAGGRARLDLTAREWVILEQLMLAAPQVVAKSRLIDSLGSWDREVTQNAVEIYVSRLRVKLTQAAPDVEVRTMRGLGYRLVTTTREVDE